MNPEQFEKQMRSMECFHSLRFLPGAWVVLRLDGRSFSRFTEASFDKPFDARFHELMVKTAKVLMNELQGLYAYTESDEISIVFPPEWDFFDRELEKTVSVSASTAAATFALACGEVVQFDSRAWLGTTRNTVVDYFGWRQSDAARCALNGWCYWTLRKQGMSAKKATSELDGRSVAFKNELLFRHGVNFNNLPAWQRRGTGLYWESYEKEGYNPKKRTKVVAVRRRIRVDNELPMKDEYRQLVRQILRTKPDGTSSRSGDE